MIASPNVFFSNSSESGDVNVMGYEKRYSLPNENMSENGYESDFPNEICCTIGIDYTNESDCKSGNGCRNGNGCRSGRQSENGFANGVILTHVRENGPPCGFVCGFVYGSYENGYENGYGSGNEKAWNVCDHDCGGERGSCEQDLWHGDWPYEITKSTEREICTPSPFAHLPPSFP